MILGAVQFVMGVLGIVLATLLDSMCESVQTETAVKILFFIVASSQVKQGERRGGVLIYCLP